MKKLKAILPLALITALIIFAAVLPKLNSHMEKQEVQEIVIPEDSEAAEEPEDHDRGREIGVSRTPEALRSEHTSFQLPERYAEPDHRRIPGS